MAVILTSAGKQPVNYQGANIAYPSKFPKGAAGYMVVHPDDAAKVAAILHQKISSLEGFEQGIPLHIFELEIEGKKLALVTTARPDFHLGLAEVEAVGKADVDGYRMELDMRAATSRWGKAKQWFRDQWNDMLDAFGSDNVDYSEPLHDKLLRKAGDIAEQRANRRTEASRNLPAEDTGTQYRDGVQRDKDKPRDFP